MPQNQFPWNSPPNGLRESSQSNAVYNTNSATANTTLTAVNLTGAAEDVVLNMTGALAAARTGTTDTAANIIAAIPQAQRFVGSNYKLRIINSSSGAFAWTIAGGTGVTVTGTATIAQDTWREFVVTMATATTITLQNVGTGTYS
ncbi:MAG TPA: hypothetical protein VN734_13305 [Acidobacteriaceae bacterium]|nr:hypothetical protein [Acidobacteriaceae bacterium]